MYLPDTAFLMYLDTGRGYRQVQASGVPKGRYRQVQAQHASNDRAKQCEFESVGIVPTINLKLALLSEY